eukprot:3503595-Prorocentrum_lima.AAC.1
MAMELGAALEPRMIMLVLAGVVGKVIKEDDILNRVWSDRTLKPHLRNPSNMLDVLTCVKIVTGEVRVRAEVELRMIPTLTN